MHVHGILLTTSQILGHEFYNKVKYSYLKENKGK
jgi:hypothetical protein